MAETKEAVSLAEENLRSNKETPESKQDNVGSPERGNLSKRAYKRLQKRKARMNDGKNIDGTPVVQVAHNCSNGLSSRDIADLINAECFNETDFYFENGLRKVYPYYYDFTAHAKGRWFGQKLVDIFVKEFQNNTLESCMQAIKGGSITVNGRPTTADYVIKNGDVIVNRVHRHELPVVSEPIQVIVDNEEVLVVNKPSSIPVHPCGRYRHNSLLYVLAREMGYRNLRGLYRLDRLTSGLLIFGRNEKRTAEMMSQIRDRLVEKEYVCRVKGEFPLEEITCDQPIGSLSEKLGIYRVTSSGKESRTIFNRISFNGTSSVVKCRPHTGRTHQIRVHLQYLGYPIVNDPLYSGDVWGESEGKNGEYGQTETELIKKLAERHSSSLYIDSTDISSISSQLCLSSSHAESSDKSSDNHLDKSAESKQQASDRFAERSFDTDNINSDEKEDKATASSERVEGVAITANIPGHQLQHEDTLLGEPEAKRLKVSADDNVTKPEVSCKSSSSEESKPRILFDTNCRECRSKYVELTPDQLVMYLHAYSYKGPGWAYQTDLPKWASDDWSG